MEKKRKAFEMSPGGDVEKKRANGGRFEWIFMPQVQLKTSSKRLKAQEK